MPKFKQKGRGIEHGGIIAIVIVLSRLVLRRAYDVGGGVGRHGSRDELRASSTRRNGTWCESSVVGWIIQARRFPAPLRTFLLG